MSVQTERLHPVAARLLARAQRELNGGRAADAEHTLAAVLALAPGNADAMRCLGAVAQWRGDHGKAAECFRRALEAWPGDSALHVNLGIALYGAGDVGAAVSQLRRGCELDPTSVLAWFNLGEALKRQAHTRDALAAFRRALDLDPAHIPARLSLATAQASIGRVDLAIAEFREVLRRDPGNARAWFDLSNLNTLRFAPEDLVRIRQAYARDGLAPEARDMLGFALAKALEDQGDYAQAFDVFNTVNASRRKYVKWDAAGEHKRVEAILRVFDGWSPPPPRDPARGREVILIVSIPRSGSTLVEQILASHPDVEGANEIGDLPAVIDAETRRRRDAFPFWLPMATDGDWQRLGGDYLARTARWRERKPRFTDKNLVAWYLVGTALAMLRAARVVLVRRDPVETCLACYRQWLTGDAGFTYDLDEMADYCIDFMRLTRFWLERFPGRILDLEYETLVAEPEPTIRRLLDFCGLTFDPVCLEFHRTQRAIQSAPSAAQVRQRLRRDTARADRYGDKLDHLRQQLRDAGLA